MAVYTPLDHRTVANFVTSYGLGTLNKMTGIPAGSVNTHYLLETSKGRIILKIDEVKSVADAERELALFLFLRTRDFPCPQPLVDRQGQYYRLYKGKPLSLYTLLNGKSVPEAQMSKAQLEHIGQLLATLHQVGSDYPKDEENRFSATRILALYQEVKERLPGYLRHLTHMLDDEMLYQQEYQEDRLPKGIIHGDLFADNLLFRKDKVVGVLDFEAACQGKFIYDVATAVNALCYIDGRFEIDRFDTFLSGYQSVRTLTLTEWDAFPNELRFSAFRFTITRLKDFFLRPMEARDRVSKDFREFFDRLQVLRRERPGGMNRLLLAMATGYDYRQYQKPPAARDKPEGRTPIKNRRSGGRQREALTLQVRTQKRVAAAR
ncbi:MAG: homoserine kinase [Deltaproteobacteria bacterium]|nr:homoserine kinase [Deltaproteobacteria bacterium]